MAMAVGRKCEEDGNGKNMEIGAIYKWEEAEIERKMEELRNKCVLQNVTFDRNKCLFAKQDI